MKQTVMLFKIDLYSASPLQDTEARALWSNNYKQFEIKKFQDAI